jgi:hypothetical protein
MRFLLSIQKVHYSCNQHANIPTGGPTGGPPIPSGGPEKINKNKHTQLHSTKYFQTISSVTTKSAIRIAK